VTSEVALPPVLLGSAMSRRLGQWGSALARLPSSAPASPRETASPIPTGEDKASTPWVRTTRFTSPGPLPADIIACLGLDAALADADLSRALFVDTETTGLDRGTGTYAFLIGLAAFEGNELVVSQYLLQELGQEAEILECVVKRLAAASVVISYNGKSYDTPLLRTRCVLNRCTFPEAIWELDLLHVARRMYGRRMPSVTLRRVEEVVLGLYRQDDIPGELIPDRFWSFLESGQLDLLEPVLCHNAQDLTSLPAVLAAMCTLYQTGDGHPNDRLSAAKVAARAGRHGDAVRLAEPILATSDATLRLEAHLLIGDLHLRNKAYHDAERVFEAAIEHAPGGGGADASVVRLRLAKLLEHRLRSPRRALEHARRVFPAEPLDAVDRRVRRLLKKLDRKPSSEALF
jgi:uncharacterized protein